MKAAGASAGAVVTGGTVLGSATAATTSADGNCVQVDLVLGNTVNDLGSNTYASQGRLVNAQWGDYENDGPEGETVNRGSNSDTCTVDITSPLSIDFSNHDASVTFDITGCDSSSQDVTLVSYETPCNSASGGQFDPANADQQTIFAWTTKTFSGNTTGNTLSVEVPDKDLIAYYPLDDAIDNGRTTVDVANGNDAAVVGNVDTAATGQVNGAYDIKLGEDTQSYLDLPAFTPGGDDSITVAGWINASDLSTDTQLAFWGDGSPQFELWYSGGLKFIYWTGSESRGITGGPTLNTDQWYHVAGTYNDSTGEWRLYVDGSQVASTTDTIGSTDNADVGFSGSNNRIASHPSNGRYVSGRLDEFVFYDRTLSQSEVQDLTNDTVATSGLIAHYELDTDTPVDSSDNGNDATISGNPDTSATGKFNGAYGFNAIAGNLDPPAFAPSGDDSISISLWVNADDLSNRREFVFWGDGPPQFEVFYEGGVEFVYYDGSNFGISGGPTLNTGQWYHVAGTYDDSTGEWTLYVDGSQVASTTDTIGSTSTKDVGLNGDSTRIGRHPSDGFQFEGLVDDVRFYNTALSSSEVTDLYNKGS
jgi:hypothetical protein